MSAHALSYLHERKFCLVFLKVLDYEKGDVKFRCHHGHAKLQGESLFLQESGGQMLPIPHSAYPQIYPSDGSTHLKDAEFFVIVKISDNMTL